MDAPGEMRNPVPAGQERELVICEDAGTVARAAARIFVAAAASVLHQQNRFCVALAGGNTPRALYRLLAGDEFRPQVDWARVHFFWTDERAVPPGHADSNFSAAHSDLLSRIAVPKENIHRMQAEREDFSAAAALYERALRRYLELDAHGFPRFHLVLLGLGADGHTASLFPGASQILEAHAWVTESVSPTLGMRRMTLTLPVLNAAHRVLFLVTGGDKAQVLKTVLQASSRSPLPAQLVVVPNGSLTFLADRDAAGRIRASPPLARISQNDIL